MGKDDGTARKLRENEKRMFRKKGGNERLTHQHLCPLISSSHRLQTSYLQQSRCSKSSNNASFLQGCS